MSRNGLMNVNALVMHKPIAPDSANDSKARTSVVDDEDSEVVKSLKTAEFFSGVDC